MFIHAPFTRKLGDQRQPPASAFLPRRLETRRKQMNEEQQLKDELERLRAKVDDDFSKWNDAARDLKKKEADEAAADAALRDAKAARDHAQWHVDQDFDRLKTDRSDEAFAELKSDQAWRDGLQADYDAALKAHLVAELAVITAKAKEQKCKNKLELDREERDKVRRELDELRQSKNP